MIARHAVVLLATVSLLAGCAAPPLFLQPSPLRNFQSALGEARAAAEAGRWATADRVLADYMLRHPGTRQAHEALFWRGVFRLAPANDSAAKRLAIPTLEQYLAQPGGDHRAAARGLVDAAREHERLVAEAARQEREIAQVRTALGRAEERAASAGSTPAPAGNDRALAQEIERLKSQLAAANQELQRIRQRLARQRP